MTDPTSDVPSKPASKIWGWILAIGAGLAWVVEKVVEHGSQEVGKWVGPYLLLPAASIAGCWWLASKTVEPKDFVPVVGLVGGQVVYFFVIALFIGAAGFLMVGPDIVVLGAGLIWLLKRRTLGPVILLMCFEGLVIVFDVFKMVNEGLAPAGVAMIAIKIASLVVLFQLLPVVRATKPAQAV